MIGSKATGTNVLVWVVGVAMAFLALVGLFVSSRAAGETIYVVGIGLFVFGVLVIFGLIGGAYGRR